MRKSAAALSIAAVCALLLAACGDSDSSSSSTATKAATVPTGKLGSSTLIYEGKYMGRTTETNPQTIKFKYSIDKGVTDFQVGALVIGEMPMTNVSFARTVGKVTIKGGWQTDTSVTGTIDTEKGSSGGTTLVQHVKWSADAFDS